MCRDVILSAAFHTLRSKKQESFRRFRLQLKQEMHEGSHSSSGVLNAAEADAQSGATVARHAQPDTHGPGAVTAAKVLALQPAAELSEAKAAHAEACMLQAEARAAEADARAASAETRAFEVEVRADKAEEKSKQALRSQLEAEEHLQTLRDRANTAAAQLAQLESKIGLMRTTLEERMQTLNLSSWGDRATMTLTVPLKRDLKDVQETIASLLV